MQYLRRTDKPIYCSCHILPMFYTKVSHRVEICILRIVMIRIIFNYAPPSGLENIVLPKAENWRCAQELNETRVVPRNQNFIS